MRWNENRIMSIEYLLLVLHEQRTALIKHLDHDLSGKRPWSIWTSGKIKKINFRNLSFPSLERRLGDGRTK